MTDRVVSPELQMYKPEVVESPTGEMLGIRFDISSLLETKIGQDWQQQAADVISTGEEIVRTGNHHTVREPVGKFGLASVEGEELAEALPGIWELYQGTFKQMMQSALPAGVEALRSYDDPHLALEPVNQLPKDPASDVERRYEAHVDQRYTAVVVIKAPESAEQGGRLVISGSPDAASLAEIDKDATYIEHRPATLFCFSRGRTYPHYTEQVIDPSAERMTIALNYPAESETLEQAHELVDHAYGKL